MQFINRKDRLLLIGLSEDSRSTVTKLSKAVGYSRVTTIKALDRLKKNLDIRFTLEVDESELKTFERHIITVKLSKKPAAKTLEKIFAKDQYAQNVYLTEGDFDLLIYATASRAVEYIVWETHLAETLVDYGAVIRPSEYVTSHFGYMPLNDNFIDAISGAQKIDDKDRAILRLLNNDSRLGYREISKQSEIPEDTVRYRLFSLRKSGIIKSITIAVQNPP
ncbi:MAG: AsnC family transcriptional regulator, partial [Candidatus Micrarchaeaceae archaeon]